MTWLWIILGLVGGGIVGFWQGTRYCARNMTAHVLARMNPKELARVVKRASDMRGLNDR